MSAAQFYWPASDTLAAARQVRYLGWTCRTDHAVGGAESDVVDGARSRHRSAIE